MFRFLATSTQKDVKEELKLESRGKEKKHHHSAKKKPSPKKKRYASESDSGSDTESVSEKEYESDNESRSSEEPKTPVFFSRSDSSSEPETPVFSHQTQLKPASAEKNSGSTNMTASVMDTSSDTKPAPESKRSEQPSSAVTSVTQQQQPNPVFSGGGNNTFFSNSFPAPVTTPLERPVGDQRFFRNYKKGFLPNGLYAQQEIISCVTEQAYDGYVTYHVKEQTKLQVLHPNNGCVLSEETWENSYSRQERQEPQQDTYNNFNPFSRF